MKWSKLKTRLCSAFILLIALLLVTFGPEWAFTLAVCIASLVVLREIMITFKLGAKPSLAIADYVFALLYMVAGFVSRDVGNQMFYMITIFFVMTLLIISVADHKNVAIQDVCASLFVVIYSVVFLMHLALIRQMESGLALVFLAFVGAWLPDTMAYFAGNLFGKRKLIEAISPNKTVAGAIGGVFGAVIGFAVYGIVVAALGYTINVVPLMVLALLCGVVAQLGDLSASVMKRAYKAKDFGKLIPGHGGLVDRVDSLIFITPVVYYFISFFPVIA